MPKRLIKPRALVILLEVESVVVADVTVQGTVVSPIASEQVIASVATEIETSHAVPVPGAGLYAQGAGDVPGFLPGELINRDLAALRGDDQFLAKAAVHVGELHVIYGEFERQLVEDPWPFARLGQAQSKDQRVGSQGVMAKPRSSAQCDGGRPGLAGKLCNTQAGEITRQGVRPSGGAGAEHILRDKQPALELLSSAKLPLQLQAHQFSADGQVGEVRQVPTGTPDRAVRRRRAVLEGDALHAAAGADPHDGRIVTGRRNDRLGQKMVSRNAGLKMFGIELIRGVPER